MGFMISLHIDIVSPSETLRSPDTPGIFDREEQVHCSADFVKEAIWIYVASMLVSDNNLPTNLFSCDMPVGFVLVLLKSSHMTEHIYHSRSGKVFHHQVLIENTRWTKDQSCVSD